MVTNCKLPNPWWTLRGPKFDIIPDSRAIAYRSVFRLRRVPLFITPFFYKALGKEPRRSGFLTPNIGNSSTRGKMLGVGYYWAFDRSYDVTYRAQYFSDRGLAHHIDFRGRPHEGADFDAIFYGVQDRGHFYDPVGAVRDVVKHPAQAAEREQRPRPEQRSPSQRERGLELFPAIALDFSRELEEAVGKELAVRQQEREGR